MEEIRMTSEVTFLRFIEIFDLHQKMFHIFWQYYTRIMAFPLPKDIKIYDFEKKTNIYKEIEILLNIK